MNPGIDYYRPFGQPAQGGITIASLPTTGDAVAIDGVTYAYGTHFFGNDLFRIAESLASAINADRSRQHLHIASSVIRSTYAVFIGTTVVIVATVPGTAGNSITLTTDNATAFVLSNATLEGGTAGSVSITGDTYIEVSAASLTKLTLVTATKTIGAAAAPLAAAPTKCVGLHLYAEPANVGTSTIGSSTLQKWPLVKGAWSTFHPPSVTAIDLNDIYLAGTLNDTVHILYWQ